MNLPTRAPAPTDRAASPRIRDRERRRLVFALLAVVLALAASSVLAGQPDPVAEPAPDPETEARSAATPDPAAERPGARPWGQNPALDRMMWAREGRVGPDGRFPPESRMRAFREYREGLRQLSSRLAAPKAPAAAIPGSEWTPLGPRPMQNGPFTFAGRVTVITPHPTDGDIVYVGTASGGVWKTLDGGLNWIPLTDRQPSLATGAIALAPGNPDTIFVGTGEPNFSCDSHFGVGILKSTDGGYSWSQLGAAYFGNRSISKIIVHPTQPQTLWASTTSGNAGWICGVAGGGAGIFKSIDGGANWSNAAFPAGDVTDLVMDPANPQVLYAGRKNSGIYKTVDGGTIWAPLGGGLPGSNIDRIDLALHPAVPGLIYAVYSNLSGNLLGHYKSADGGATWAPFPLPQASWQCSLQCWFDLALEIAPDGSLWEGSYRLVRTADDGANWAIRPNNYVDQHAIAFAPDGRIWAGHDGGVDVSSDGGASWSTRNANLGAMQFYPGGSLHPTNGAFAISGAQDNGTSKYTGGATWTKILSADGGATAIDSASPDLVWYASIQYLQVYKTVAGGGFSAVNSGLADSNVSGKAPFMAPLVMCPGNPQVLIAGSDNVWRTGNGAGGWSANSADPIVAGASIRSLAFDPSDASCGTYYAGTSGGKVFRTTVGGGAAAGNWVDISTGLGGHGVSDLAVDPGNPNVVYAAITGYGAGTQIYKTVNALAPAPTWNPAAAGLPNIPTNAVLVDPGASAVVYAGTDLGVYRSVDSGANWSPFMTGHPVVPVHDLKANAATGTLVSFTHGRGAFKLTAPAARPVPDGKFIPGLPLRAGKGTGSSIRLLFDSASCVHGATHAYWGPLTPAALATYAYGGQECGIVSGGSLTTIPAATSAFFVVVGADGSGVESGNTRDSAGVWRGSGVGRCGIAAQSSAASCP